MGQYNPHAPHILGQEWVPIRNETINFPDDFSSVAVGQRFPLRTSHSITEVHWYMENFPSDDAIARVGVDIYPGTTEDLTGPIKRVLIPVSSGSVTGSEVSFSGVSTMQAALLSPGDANYLNANVSNAYVSTAPAFTVYFAGASYAAALQGKRILAINVLYVMNFPFSQEFMINNNAGDGATSMSLVSNVGTHAVAFSNWGEQSSLPFDYAVDSGSTPPNNIQRVTLGAVTPFWIGGTPLETHQYSWIPTDLARFEVSAPNRLGIRVNYFESDGAVNYAGFSTWEYMALEVFYCEENRVATGSFAPDVATLGAYGYTYGANAIVVRDPFTRVGTTIGPGDVTVVAYPVLTEGYNNPSGNVVLPTQGLRQLYPISTVDGIRLKMPFPFDESIVDQTFVSEQTNVVPQLTLHTNSAVIPECYPYGRQAVAEVYGTESTDQEIQDYLANGSRTYAQVRFYARRWGLTSVPLRIQRSSAPTTEYASITAEDFDTLPEIIDGWKEVTLRLPEGAVQMGSGTTPTWEFLANAEVAGNRWEILGASAPALSGTPGNLLTLATSSYVLSNATYGATGEGGTVNLTWMPGISPMVTAPASDATSDAVLMFSTDPQTPTGLAVSPISQALATVDPDCPIDPSCIPSDLYYHHLGWLPISGASLDNFNRVAVSGWGSTDLGQPWNVGVATGLGAAFFSVNGDYGQVTHPANTATDSRAAVDVRSGDVEAQVDFNVNQVPISSSINVMIGARSSATLTDFVRALVSIQSTSVMRLSLSRTVGGVTTAMTPNFTSADVRFSTESWYRLKIRASGALVFAKLWERNQPEPLTWQLTTVDASIPYGTYVWLGANQNGADVAETVVSYENFMVSPADFGAIELQRYDPVDGEFNTIMLSSNPATTGFSDYEARVGQPSVYRLRTRNVYDFAGMFGDPVTGTLASPGVSGASTALLLFTSNYRQDGSINLAYSAEWDTGNPVEDFGFPEASQVVLQQMYQKNFPTAFRPLERGGEVFQRTILVSAAGVPAVASGNGFNSLQDMAWDTAPYICVRDELGNRWYSTILVPDGRRRRMRGRGHLLTASVQVVEVTESPYPVDP